jgi:peptide/nickel transport system permease protein
MRYLLRRAGFYLVALWAAVTFNFIIPRLMPGNPALAYLARVHAQYVTPSIYNAYSKNLAWTLMFPSSSNTFHI